MEGFTHHQIEKYPELIELKRASILKERLKKNAKWKNAAIVKKKNPFPTFTQTNEQKMDILITVKRAPHYAPNDGPKTTLKG